ncbi:MAG: MG2 domain-containing protein, partial [Candidatus Zixiibacteriota bacterium]
MSVKTTQRLMVLLVLLSALGLSLCGCDWAKTKITVTRFAPEGEVPQKTNFTITFSENVVPPESVDVWMEPDYLEIQPPLEGKCKWISESELRFYPEEPLRPSTQYSLKISPKLVKPTGKWLSAKKAYEFHTARIRVDNYTHRYMSDEKRPGLAGLFITIEFNYEIYPQDLQERLKIRFEKGKSIDYQIEQKSSSRVLTATSGPLPLKDIEREIRLHIDESLKPEGGTLSLFEDYDVTFAMPARQRLIVERAYPEASGEDNWITIQFSTPVAIDAVKDFVTIDPEISFDLERNHRYLSLRGEFSPGEVYVVTLKKGFLALNGTELETEFSTAIEMKEMEPYLNFVTPGIFLPKKGSLNVGIETVNIDTLELSIDKIFVNNLVYFLNTNQMYGRYFRRGLLGKHVTSKEIEIEGERNVKVMTTIDMGDYLDQEREGIYILTLRRPEQRWHSTIKWVRITDLGISAKIGYDELTVYINSLENLAPHQGARVKLISKTNQVLLEGITNSEGVADLGNYRQATEGFESFVITAEKGKDLSFAKLADCRLSLGDFDVGGDPVPREGYEAFLYTDRGVYRPGDTVHMVTIIRQADGEIPPDFPLKIQILAPDGSIFNEYRGWVGDAGADEFNVDIPLYAMTGVYTARTLIADSVEVGRKRFNVEEFMPQRIRVEISLDKESYTAGQDVDIEVKGTMLFGPPAAERKVEAKCTISSRTFTPAGFSRFHFDDREKKFD